MKQSLNTRPQRRLLRGAVAVGVAACAFGATASSAFAYSDTFYPGTLSPGYGYASGTAHTGVYRVYVNSDHQACPGLATGFAGSQYGTSNTVMSPLSGCGYGGVNWYPKASYSTSSVHGFAFNPTSTWNDVIANAFYTS